MSQNANYDNPTDVRNPDSTATSQEKHDYVQSLAESLMNLNATDRYEIAMHLLHSVWSRVNLQDGANAADRKLIEERIAEMDSGCKMYSSEEVLDSLRLQVERRKSL